jgi:hypothetical protein
LRTFSDGGWKLEVGREVLIPFSVGRWMLEVGRKYIVKNSSKCHLELAERYKKYKFAENLKDFIFFSSKNRRSE